MKYETTEHYEAPSVNYRALWSTFCQLQNTMEHDVVQAGDYVDKIIGDFTMVLQELSELHRLKL